MWLLRVDIDIHTPLPHPDMCSPHTCRSCWGTLLTTLPLHGDERDFPSSWSPETPHSHNCQVIICLVEGDPSAPLVDIIQEEGEELIHEGSCAFCGISFILVVYSPITRSTRFKSPFLNQSHSILQSIWYQMIFHDDPCFYCFAHGFPLKYSIHNLATMLQGSIYPVISIFSIFPQGVVAARWFCENVPVNVIPVNWKIFSSEKFWVWRKNYYYQHDFVIRSLYIL